MVNTILEGEMDSFMREQFFSGVNNKRNGKTVKKIRTNTGNILV